MPDDFKYQLDPQEAERIITQTLEVYRTLSELPSKTAKLTVLRFTKRMIEIAFAYHKQKGLEITDTLKAEALQIYRGLETQIEAVKAQVLRRRRSSSKVTRRSSKSPRR